MTDVPTDKDGFAACTFRPTLDLRWRRQRVFRHERHGPLLARPLPHAADLALVGIDLGRRAKRDSTDLPRRASSCHKWGCEGQFNRLERVTAAERHGTHYWRAAEALTYTGGSVSHIGIPCCAAQACQTLTSSETPHRSFFLSPVSQRLERRILWQEADVSRLS